MKAFVPAEPAPEPGDLATQMATDLIATITDDSTGNLIAIRTGPGQPPGNWWATPDGPGILHLDHGGQQTMRIRVTVEILEQTP